MTLTRNERAVIDVLIWARRRLPTRVIARYARLAYSSAYNSLESLHSKRYLRREKRGRAVYWWIHE